MARPSTYPDRETLFAAVRNLAAPAFVLENYKPMRCREDCTNDDTTTIAEQSQDLAPQAYNASSRACA
jgi:hypothetical protein